MKTLKITFALAIAALTLSTTLMFGKAEYSKTEKKGCTYCHTKAGSKDLNDVGKCYEKNKHSLKGCEDTAKDKK